MKNISTIFAIYLLSITINPIFAPPKKMETDSVAQLVEHNTFNVGVLGSSPSGITKY
jgi:hypothetical protein